MRYVVTLGSALYIFFILHQQAEASDEILNVNHEVGVSISNYTYKEPDLNDSNNPAIKSTVKHQANKFGINYALTLKTKQAWYLKGDIRYATGKTDYSYNGTTMKNIPDWYYDLRGLIGKEIKFSSTVLSPYTGLGYRFLRNDSKGMKSNDGKNGYLRENELIYLPVGVNHVYPLEKQAQLVTNGEVDIVMKGLQHSYLSHLNLADFSNRQRSGYGLRASMTYHTNHWFVGPWVQYWNILKSEDLKYAGVIVYEPKNSTTEAGVALGYKF